MSDTTTATSVPVSRLEYAKAFAAAGFVTIPLAGKKPCCKPGCPAPHKGCGDDWEQTIPGRWTPEELAAGGNFGVALKASNLVIDVDPRHFTPGDDPLARLKKDIGDDLAGAFKVFTGGGGGHIYLTKDPDIAVRNSLKEYPGLEFKSLGRQMVAPGSIHPETKKPYTIAAHDPATEYDAPDALIALIKRVDVPFSELPGTNGYVNDAHTQGRFIHYLEDLAPVTGSFVVACKGRDFGLPPQITWELMMEVWNPRRDSAKTPEEMREKIVHAYKYASGVIGAKHPSTAFEPAPETPETPQPPKEEPWVEDWDQTPQGGIKKTFKNLMLYLRCPRYGLSNVFATNEFTGRVEFVTPAPWHRGDTGHMSLPVEDDDVALLKGYLATRMKFDTTMKEIAEAITNVAYHKRFHPVREYLDGLKWDGVPRLDFWLRDYLGVADSPYSRACARKTLCAAVMRVRHPAIKFDHVLTLEGPGDLGKSTAVEILGGAWATDAPVDPHSRDTVDMMQGRWIIEMAEMEVARRADEEALKAFITRRVDLARLAYGRKTREFKRQSIFIATKNPKADGTYFSGDSDNLRRWWPVRCNPKHGLGQIDFKGLRAVRDQLFAEAVVRAPQEKLYMETQNLKADAKTEAAQRHAEHEWTERIAEWINTHDKEWITSREVYIEAMRGDDVKFDRRAEIAIAQVLRHLGWKTTVKWKEGRAARGYQRATPKMPSTKKSSILEALDNPSETL